MDLYMRTEPRTSFKTQLVANAIRRLLVFKREPRQWFALASPYLISISMILITLIIVVIIKNALHI
jgi:hypothetical protein